MTGSTDPWALLGISRQAEERDIKKAYARLLKIARPDRDIRAFQDLVEARNTALAFARRAAAAARAIHRHETGGSTEAENSVQAEDLNEAENSRQAEDSNEAADANASSVQSRRPARVHALLTSDPRSGADPRPVAPPMLDMSSKAPPAVEANPDVQADESIAIVAPATSLPAVDVKPKTPPISSPAPETTAPPTGESSKARPALLSRSQDLAEPDVTENNLPKLLSTIVAGLDPHADAAAIETTDKVIGKLTALSSAARKLAEARLLHALMLLTPVISTRLMKGRPWGLSWLMTMMSREDADRRRAALQLTFVQRLNEEFGWTQQDRRVYELVGREGGSALVSHLNAFGRALGVSKAAAEGRNAPRTLPLLDERDARAFFRDNYTSQAPLLAKVRSGDRLPARWQTGVFLTLPWWLLKTGNFGFLIIWLVAAVTAVKVIAAADEHRFASIRFLDQEIHYWPLAAVVAYLPLLALHFWAAAYAYRWDISRLRNRVAAADRRGIFDPGRRAVFIGRTLNRFLRSCGVFVLLPTLFAVFVALLGSLIAIIAGSHTVALSPNDRTPVEAVAFAAVVLVMAAYGWVKKVK